MNVYVKEISSKIACWKQRSNCDLGVNSRRHCIDLIPFYFLMYYEIEIHRCMGNS